MGRLSKQVLGFLQGKVGGYVIRKRYGKAVVYVLPETYNLSQTPEAKKSRAKIIPMSRFSSFIASIPELKYIWAHNDINASSAYHKIIKLNFPLFEYNCPTKGNIITPLGSFLCSVTDQKISPEGFSFDLIIEENKRLLLKGAKEVTAIGVICFYDPLIKKKEYFALSKIIIDSVDLKVDETFKIILPFDEEGKKYYSLYKNIILYFTLVTKDNNGTPLRHSMWYSEEFTRTLPKVRKGK